jgi:hypothetical protein
MPTIFLHLGKFQPAKVGKFQPAETGEYSTGVDSFLLIGGRAVQFHGHFMGMLAEVKRT